MSRASPSPFLHGHLLALSAALVWGTTFVVTKLLLSVRGPVEILFDRFLLAWALLWLIQPRREPWRGWRGELGCAALGVCGVTLYFLAENVALQLTQASNVGLLVLSAPLLTALLSHWLQTGEDTSRRLWLGSALALIGVALVMFNGRLLQLNPLGDILALAAGASWAVYSLLLKRTAAPHGVLLLTRKVFGYGLISMLPALWLTGYRLPDASLWQSGALYQLLFLGMIASALCYVLWNRAVQVIGAVKSSNYIYLIPLVTLATSVWLLDERLTLYTGCGAALIIAGVWLAEHGPSQKKPEVSSQNACLADDRA